jgi:CSLREA domain-containing protein/uncharacterized repeat protein (TIGR01451 family)
MYRLGILSIVLGALFASANAQASGGGTNGGSTFVVNSLADPGSGACDAAECTLREAIAAAAGSGGGSIEFEAGLSGTITLGSQLFINTNGIVINGPGPDVIAVSGNNVTRVFRIAFADPVIRGLTVRDGNSTSDAQTTSGAGILISNNANPTLENLRVVDNVTNFLGGGINVFFSSATIRNSEVSGNTAGRQSGIAINGSDGNDVLIENTTVSGNIANQAESGIGVLTNAGQNVTLRYVTVAGNTGSPWGSLISGNGQTIIEASVFADNVAPNGDLRISGANDLVNDSVIGNLDGSVNGSNNLTDIDVALGSLRFLAGATTRIHPLGAGPGRDHVLGSGCGTTVTLDQRGMPRPQAARCDAGAFEAEAPVLLADWTFEEFTPGEPLLDEERVNDGSGTERDARIAGGAELPVAVLGRTDSTALEFDSSADRVVFQPGYAFGDGGPVAGPAIEFGQDDSFTLEALVRIPDGISHVGSFIAKDVGPGQASWWFRVNGSTLEALIGDGPNQAIVTGTTPINDGGWHHVALVRDAEADELRVYVDQILDGSAPDTTQGDSFTATDIVLGAFNNVDRELNGAMDFARMTRGALLPEQFVQLPLGPDLAVSIEDGTNTVAAGDLIDYVVTIANQGDEDAIDAVVEDVVPVQIVATSWSCSASGGASCPSSGSGALAETVTLPVGGSVVFTITASITPDDFDSVTYTVGATVAAPQQDVDPANNTASDINRNVRIFRDRFEAGATGFR